MRGRTPSNPTGDLAGDVLKGAVLLPRIGVSAIAGGLITAAALYVLGFLVLPAVFPEWLAPFRGSPVMHVVEIAMHGIYGLVFGWSYRRTAK